ncbi:MAG: aldose 1-epimerase family protein [Lachnospiraceae bacterium]|nr:aldose 1-epimerase family protein [Lachnospiraceae bacterium]
MRTKTSFNRLKMVTDNHGGELVSVIFNDHEYLWQGDPTYWAGQAPILFPIVGALPGGELMAAAGPCRMGRHGIVQKRDFRLYEKTPISDTYEFVADEESKAAYPYDFRLLVKYIIISGNAIETRFYVENTGDVDLPFVLGGHPAFNLPLGGDDCDFSDYYLKFKSPMTADTMRLDENGIFKADETVRVLDNSDRLPLSHALFENDALCLSNVPKFSVTLMSDKSSHGITMDFEEMPYLGVWSAKGDAPFVALEPWLGHSSTTADDGVFEHKAGMIMLKPGDARSFSFTMTFF